MLQEIINLIVTNGMAVVIIAYFLFKDYKFNEQIIDVLGEMKEVLTELKTWHKSEENKNDLHS